MGKDRRWPRSLTSSLPKKKKEKEKEMPSRFYDVLLDKERNPAGRRGEKSRS